MEFRFFLLLLFAFLICESIQAKFFRKLGRSKFRSSVHKTTSIGNTRNAKEYGSSGGSVSHSFLLKERGGQTKKQSHYTTTAPRPLIRATAAPTRPNENLPWANPYYVSTKIKTPPTTNNNNRNVFHSTSSSYHNQKNSTNNYKVSVPQTTKSPFDIHTNARSFPNTRNVTTTAALSNQHTQRLTNSTVLRNPNVGTGYSSDSRPTQIQQNQGTVSSGSVKNSDTNQPFHKTNLNLSQSVPISHASTYPQQQMQTTRVQTHEQNFPPYGLPSVQHPGNHVYSNEHLRPQPNYPGSLSNPGGSYNGGVYYGPSGVPYGGQVQYPQHAPIGHPGSSPTIIMVPNQQDNGRGAGQIFKEALIYSGVNAVMNRIINPSSYHHHHEYPGNSGQPVASAQNTQTSNTHSETHTEIIYNNQFNNIVPGNTGMTLGQPGVPQPGIPGWNSPSGLPVGQVNQPGTMIPIQSIPPGINGVPMVPGTATVGQPVVPGTTNIQTVAPGTPSIGQPAVSASTQSDSIPPPYPEAPDSGTANAPITNSPNPQKTVSNTFQYRITDQELQSISEDLFNKDEFNAYQYITLNKQGRSTSPNANDQAAGPLFHVMPIAYTIPTVQALRSMYEHYTLDSKVKEIMTMERRMKENILLDVFLTTHVMSITMAWLCNQGFVKNDDFEKKDMLNRLWFTQFDGTSTAFERVFVAEVFNGTDVLGVQDWVHFDYYESNNRINYLGYVDELQFGNRAAMLKVDFRFDGVLRQNGTLFIGTSPELEMALYTICYYARPRDICPISLGGTKFNLYTNPYRYLGKDTVNLALPVF